MPIIWVTDFQEDIFNGEQRIRAKIVKCTCHRNNTGQNGMWSSSRFSWDKVDDHTIIVKASHGKQPDTTIKIFDK